MNTFKHKSFAVLLICSAVIGVYSNTLLASWHFDDYWNILHHADVQINDLHPKSIYQTFFIATENHKQLYRPLARFTLALNWYWGGKNVVGYHVFNIGIHIVTSLLLFVTIIALFDTPRLKNQRTSHKITIALVAALLWALNPIQTQAVTYIIQRMASMAALFYLGSLYAYLRARIATRSQTRVGWFFLSSCSFLLAMASKENAILLPVTLLLMEVIFFKDFDRKYAKSKWSIVVILGSLAVILGVLGLTAWKGNPLVYLTSGYATRPYTMGERLLTQPRILLFYLSRRFMPLPSRLSIEHGVSISSGWLTPWTTIPSLIGVLALIALGVFVMRKKPLVAFGLLFFFINHLVESSILPLELLFEHRNYLPSMFLFLPLAVVLMRAIDYYQPHSQIMPVMIISATALILFFLGTGTYIRNMAWASEKTLWEDAIRKAPQSGRAHHNLAWGHYHRSGQYTKALQHYKQALQLQGQGNPLNFATYLNVAAIYLDVQDYERAVAFFKKALEIRPDNKRAQQGLSRAINKLKPPQRQLEVNTNQ